MGEGGTKGRRGRLLAIAAALGLLIVSTTSAGSVLPQPISSDPYTNGGPQHQTQVEPDSYAYGSTIVSAFQVGRYFSGGSSNIGFATSHDGGTTWTHGFLPGTTPDSTPAGGWARA